MEVSVRELKDHLFEYLRRAAAGEVIVVTSHARPVACLSAPPVPPEQPSDEEALRWLRAQPWVRPGSGLRPRLPRPLLTIEEGEKTLAEMVIEDRG